LALGVKGSNGLVEFFVRGPGLQNNSDIVLFRDNDSDKFMIIYLTFFENKENINNLRRIYDN